MLVLLPPVFIRPPPILRSICHLLRYKFENDQPETRCCFTITASVSIPYVRSTRLGVFQILVQKQSANSVHSLNLANFRIFKVSVRFSNGSSRGSLKGAQRMNATSSVTIKPTEFGPESETLYENL